MSLTWLARKSHFVKVFFEKLLKFLSYSFYAVVDCHFRAAVQPGDLFKAQSVQRVEQEPAALCGGAVIQHGKQLVQRFPPAYPFLRRFLVAAALGGDYVLVKLPYVPMSPLLIRKVLLFVVGPVKAYVNHDTDLHGQGLSVYFDGDFHLPFLRFDLGLCESKRGRRGAATGPNIGPT